MKKQVSVALTQEGERNHAQFVDASRQRVDDLRALARKQKRVKKGAGRDVTTIGSRRVLNGLKQDAGSDELGSQPRDEAETAEQ